MNYIALGVITKPFGIKGEVRLRPYNPRTAWFDAAEGLWLRRGDVEPEYIRIVKARWHKEDLVLTLAGVRDRDGAEALRGLVAVAPEDQLGPLDDGEYYWHQLIGLSVEDPAGAAVGKVARMTETAPELGGNDIIVVATAEGEFLVPAGPDAVRSVDLAAGRIVIDPAFVTKDSD